MIRYNGKNYCLSTRRYNYYGDIEWEQPVLTDSTGGTIIGTGQDAYFTEDDGRTQMFWRVFKSHDELGDGNEWQISAVHGLESDYEAYFDVQNPIKISNIEIISSSQPEYTPEYIAVLGYTIDQQEYTIAELFPDHSGNWQAMEMYENTDASVKDAYFKRIALYVEPGDPYSVMLEAINITAVYFGVLSNSTTYNGDYTSKELVNYKQRITYNGRIY